MKIFRNIILIKMKLMQQNIYNKKNKHHNFYICKNKFWNRKV